MKMALQKNKVKFGLNKVHYAKITAWSDEGVPTFATPVRLPGAVSLSIDANGENENFYADNCVYYVINNNAGYDGDLEVALITTDFATAILGEQLDSKGVLVERNDAESAQFALMFEFDGDKNHIRHVLYCCSASRPATEGETTEESKSVKTEKPSLKASALPSGLVKSKTCESTDQTTYDNWYSAVYIPAAATTNNSTGTRSTSTKGGSTAAATTTD
jgi:phi13 family phage major tail protein